MRFSWWRTRIWWRDRRFADEVTIAEAIARALAAILAEEEALLAAWNGGPPLARTLSVSTHAGAVEVTLRAPYPEETTAFRPPYAVLADLFELASDGNDPDPAVRAPLEDELLRRFVASPEAGALTDPQACHLVMDLAADYLGATIATLGSSASSSSRSSRASGARTRSFQLRESV
jgi:hypothetical protein